MLEVVFLLATLSLSEEGLVFEEDIAGFRKSTAQSVVPLGETLFVEINAEGAKDSITIGIRRIGAGESIGWHEEFCSPHGMTWVYSYHFLFCLQGDDYYDGTASGSRWRRYTDYIVAEKIFSAIGIGWDRLTNLQNSIDRINLPNFEPVIHGGLHDCLEFSGTPYEAQLEILMRAYQKSIVEFPNWNFPGFVPPCNAMDGNTELALVAMYPKINWVRLGGCCSPYFFPGYGFGRWGQMETGGTGRFMFDAFYDSYRLALNAGRDHFVGLTHPNHLENLDEDPINTSANHWDEFKNTVQFCKYGTLPNPNLINGPKFLNYVTIITPGQYVDFFQYKQPPLSLEDTDGDGIGDIEEGYTDLNANDVLDFLELEPPEPTPTLRVPFFKDKVCSIR